jgi:hypothetical protein
MTIDMLEAQPMTNEALRTLVDRFVQDLTAAIQDNVLNVVRSALESAPDGGRAGRGRGRLASVRAAGRGKRDAQQLEALSAKLRSYIVKHPGQRMEQIAKGLGTSTKELVLPARKLLAGKQIATKGQRRATTYFPKG